MSEQNYENGTGNNAAAPSMTTGLSDLEVFAAATTLDAHTASGDPAPALSPLRIGRYLIISHIGSGGMGAVYSAYDPQLERKVAIKLVRSSRPNKESQARLLAEARTLARLSHPHIVGIYDAGAIDDQVFIVMEFIRGITLETWRTQSRHTWKERLSVYIHAGQGLEAAHQAGIVHRDFKPQNLILSEDGAVKVLDFGLACTREKFPEENLAKLQGFTKSGSHVVATKTLIGTLVGTPAYMSPEQHLGEVATAASDQFSFCVALYQCLYGKLPFSTNSIEALRDDVMRGHVGAAPPQSPVPARIFKVLRRGMMVESDQRFASMAELLTALERDPGALYRRVTALTMTAVVTGAAGFTMAGGSAIEVCPDAHAELAGVWDAERAGAVHASVHATASAQAGEMLARVEPQLAAYADTWARLRRDACTAHAEGRHSTQLFDLQTSCLAQRRASLDALVDKLVTASAAELNPLMQATAKLPALDTCADAEALMAAVPPPEEKELRARVQGHREGLARAQVYEDTGQYRLGLEVVDGILADREVRGYAPLLAEAWLRKGGLQMQGGDLAAAEQALTTAVLTAIACGHDSVVAQASSRRGFLFMLRGRLAQAQAALPEISAFNQRVQRNIDGYAEFLEYAAAIQWMGGENDKAWRTLEEALALLEQHGRLETPRSLGILHNLGMANRETGRYEAAADIGRRVIRLSDQLFGPAYPKRTLFEVVLSHNLRDLGRPREAYAGLSRLAANFTHMESKRSRVDVLTALGIGALAEGAGGVAWRYLIDALRLDPEYFGAQANYWTLLMWAAAETGDAAAMQRYHDEALDRLAQPLSLEDVYYQMFLLDHGRALGALGRFQEAIEPLERLRAGLAGSESVVALRNAAEASLELGKLRVAIGEVEAAEEALRQALAGFERVLSPRNLELAVTQMALGELALARGRFDEAVMWLAGAESIFGTTAEADYPPLARARFALARARTGAARSAAPTDRALAELALAALRANARMDEARAVEVWLAEHR